MRFIVPFAPGAGTDTTARTIAQKLAEKWGQQVVVDNRTGAGGAIGVDFTAKANPDGYTICLISASNSVNSATNPSLPYDLEKDLQGISQATSLFYVVYIHPSVPAKSVKELIAYAKANPGKLNFGTSGTGTLQHFSGELFNHQAGMKIVHVPYKGTAAVIPAMLSGEVQVGFGSLIGTRPQMQANRCAASRSPRRSARPRSTCRRSPNRACRATKSTSGTASSRRRRCRKPIVTKLNARDRRSAQVARRRDSASRPTARRRSAARPEQFNAHIRSEIAKWKRLVKEAKLKLHQG